VVKQICLVGEQLKDFSVQSVPLAEDAGAESVCVICVILL